MFRLATPDDLAVVTTLVAEFCAIDHHEFDAVRVQRAMQPLLADDTYGVVWLVVDDHDQPAGYAVVTWGYAIESGGRDALLDEIYVRDREHGRGGELIETILDDCRRRGLSQMFLETESHNERVRAFYARHGFVVDPSIWMSRPL
jgi:GNAT superfamily N-acetyltransferase